MKTTTNFITKKDFLGHYYWLIRCLLLRKSHLVVVFISALLIYGLGLGLPLYAQIAIDSARDHMTHTAMLLLASGVLLSTILEAFLINLRQYYIVELGNFLDSRISTKFFAHLMRIDLASSDISPGDMINKFQKTSQIRNFALELVPQIFFELGGALISIALILYYDVVIGILVVATNLFFSIVLRTRLQEFHKAAKMSFEKESQRQNFLAESVNGLTTIKTLAIENIRISKWKSLTQSFISASRRVSIQSRYFMIGSHIATRAVTLITLVFGCYRVLSDVITIGELMALQLLALRVSGPIMHASDVYRRYQDFRISIENFAQFISEPIEKSAAGIGLRTTASGGISVSHLSFKYPHRENFVLQNVSFELPDRGFIAIVGRNGSGKTSLLRILLGLQTDFQGDILIGNKSISQYDPRALRKFIGVVNQETVLFSGTIRENLSYGSSPISDDAMWRALEFSESSFFVSKLANGLDIDLEENGRNLSGGQRQRISISRAIIRNPNIIILDEPTAFLDAESALLLEKKLVALSATSLVVLVTHNLAIAREAERVLVLDNGILVGNGQHDILLQHCEAYCKLWSDYQRDFGAHTS